MKTLIGLLTALACAANAADELKLKATVTLPGVKGRFDHFAIDTNGHRLFVAALGNNTVEIIDTTAAKRVQTVTGQHKPCGIAFIPATHRFFVANGDDGTVKVYDSESYQLVKNITGLNDADNVRYDAKTNLVYVGYGDGALAAIDPEKLEIVARIQLKAHPESFQLEQNGPRAFVNVPDAKEIAVVDRERRIVISAWSMEKFQANFPMALDESNHRLFVGCRKPPRVVVLDTETGKATTDLAICGDTDDLFYDGRRNRLYVSCGEGFVDVIQISADAGKRVASVRTAPGGRTSFFSAPLDLLFVAIPSRGQQAELQIFQPQKISD